MPHDNSDLVLSDLPTWLSGYRGRTERISQLAETLESLRAEQDHALKQMRFMVVDMEKTTGDPIQDYVLVVAGDHPQMREKLAFMRDSVMASSGELVLMVEKMPEAMDEGGVSSAVTYSLGLLPANMAQGLMFDLRAGSWSIPVVAVVSCHAGGYSALRRDGFLSPCTACRDICSPQVEVIVGNEAVLKWFIGDLSRAQDLASLNLPLYLTGTRLDLLQEMVGQLQLTDSQAVEIKKLLSGERVRVEREVFVEQALALEKVVDELRDRLLLRPEMEKGNKYMSPNLVALNLSANIGGKAAEMRALLSRAKVLGLDQDPHVLRLAKKFNAEL